MPPQATIEARTGHLGVEELAGDDQQVIEGQQRLLAQADDDGFLGTGPRSCAAYGVDASTFDRIAVLPLAHGGPG